MRSNNREATKPTSGHNAVNVELRRPHPHDLDGAPRRSRSPRWTHLAAGPDPLKVALGIAGVGRRRQAMSRGRSKPVARGRLPHGVPRSTPPGSSRWPAAETAQVLAAAVGDLDRRT